MLKKSFLTVLLACVTLAAGAFEYYIESGKYRMKISESEKHTIRDMVWNRSAICVGADYYGAVVSPARGINIGAGQRKETNKEKLLACKITCDGKVVEPKHNTRIKGNKITIEKISMFDKLLFLTRLELTPEGFAESCRFVATAEQRISSFYAHIYCFNKDVSEFLAFTEDNYDITGKFDKPGQWHVSSEVKSLSLYNEKNKKGVTLYYPQVIPGADRNAAVWERSNTKKFYMMTKLDKVIPANWESRTYSVVLRCFEAASAKDFPAAAKAAAEAAGKIKLADLPKPELPKK